MTTTLRHQTILKHFSLVDRVAARLYRRLPNHVDFDELISVGAVGLIDAVNRFQDDRGVPFERYAEIRIQGSMIDHLRQQDWVPRSVRERSRDIDQLKGRLAQQLDRDPTAIEVAKAFGITIAEYRHKEAQAKIRTMVSTESPIGDEGGSLGDLLTCAGADQLEQLEKSELLSVLRDAVGSLEHSDRRVIEQYFFEELTLREIGSALGVTESRACQLRQRAVRRLRKQLRVRLPSTQAA
jgi:RNA polymerase sigma factor for flagellar operon FliA